MIGKIENLNLEFFHPLTTTTITFVLAILFWGPGTIAIAMIIGVLFFAGIGFVIITIMVNEFRRLLKKNLTRLIFIIVAVTFLSFQFYATSPNKLKSAFLNPELSNQFVAEKGKLYSIGGEVEIFIKLKSSLELKNEFIKSNNLELKSIENSYKFNKTPKWFPKKEDPNIKIYEYTNSKTEESIVALIPENSKYIFGFYLAF